MTDIEKNKVCTLSPSVDQIEVPEVPEVPVGGEEQISSFGDRKFKSYFLRNSKNIIKRQNRDIQSIHQNSLEIGSTNNSDAFPGSSSDESAEEENGSNKAYTTIVDFDETNINQLVHHNRDSGQFANIWSIIILFSTTYNFITCWYFLGIVGFPNGYWLTLEIFVEIILFSDFFIRIYIRNAMPNVWNTMWIMQYKKQSDGGFFDSQVMMILLASIPQSWIFYLIFSKQPQILVSFPIAASRILKFLRFPQIDKFFDVKEIESLVQKSHMSLRKIQVVFYFLLATHATTCIWLIVGRIDPNRNNWFALARYNGPTSINNVRQVTPGEMYVDSLFYCVSTMTGMGYGNVVPLTNLENFAAIMIMILGSSLYVAFFADFAVEVYIRNNKSIENEHQHEQAKQFSLQRNLPDDLKTKIRQYYNDARLNFQIRKAKFQILDQLPQGLKGEISLFFNNQLIQKVKFFQLAEPSFILAMSRSLTPQMCLQKDYVVYLDQVATKMYFIQQGIVQIMATDYKTVIALQSEGCYFGEIGVLLMKKHSCSVKAVTMCNFMTITKGQLETIFESFPQQAKFLRAVGRQRLLTTKPEDLDGYEENVFEAGNGEKVQVEEIEYQKVQKSMLMSSYLTKSFVAKDLKILNQKKVLSSSQRIKSLNTSMNVYNFKSNAPQVDIESVNLKNLEKQNGIDNQIKQNTPAKPEINIEFYQSFKTIIETKFFLPWHLTEEFKNETKFVIIPFSHVFNMWTMMMVLSTAYFIFMVPYQIALDYRIYEEAGLNGLIPDIIFNLSFISDIFLRSRLAFITDDRGGSEITTDIDQIQAYYVEKILIYDIIAGIPFEYLMLPLRKFGHIAKLTTIMRLLKFLKGVRIIETFTIFKRHSNISPPIITFTLLFPIFIILAHFMASINIFIARREVGKNHRFDGFDMFTDMINRNFMTPTSDIVNQNFPYLPPVAQMSKFTVYVQIMYLACSTMGSIAFGDVIPYAMAEQVYGVVAMFTSRIFLAFVFAEAASYQSSVHEIGSKHTQTVTRIKQWSELNQLPEVLKKRIDRYYQILWKKFKGVRQHQILEDLPVTLRMDVRLCLFKNIIENWEVMIGNEDHGVISSIIENFKLRIIPQDEFIIKFGEIAQHMYFIVKGQVNCISSEGIHLSQIGMGKILGTEILQQGSVRSTTIQAATDVTVAIMTTEDFLKICELYPSFKKRMAQIVINRDQENKDQIIKVIEETMSNEIKSRQQPENFEKNLNKNQTISDNQEVKSAPSFRVQLSYLNKPQKIVKSVIELTEQNLIPPIVNSPPFKPSRNIQEQFTGRKLLGTERDQNSAISRSEFQQEQDEESRQQIKEKKDSESSDLSKSKKSRNGQMASGKNSRFTRVSLKAGGIKEYFEMSVKRNQNQFQNKFKLCSIREFMRWSILILVSYNVVFIPIQFGYRIKFDGFVLAMEILTIIFYILDIKFRVQNIQLYSRGVGFVHESETLSQLTTINRDKDKYANKIKLNKIEIACSTIALIPFSLIFQCSKFHEPLALVNTLCMLRTVKILPLDTFFVSMKAKSQHKWRVIEVIVQYYLFCHLVSCIFISMGLFLPDVRAGWLRKVPSPQEFGMRENPTMDDVTSLTIYLHAIWFVTNTASHIAVGDVSAVTSIERIYVSVFIWIASFLYAFLFGNIVSIVSDFAPVHQQLYFEKYQYVMQRLGPMKNNKSLVRSINEYFDYIWGTDQFGSVEELFKSDLPLCLRQDILLCKHKEAIESSLIFKDDSGAVDISLANSIIRLMKIRVYMTNEYVFKVGSLCPQTYVLLEGQAVLAGACRLLNVVRSPDDQEGDIIGIIKVGGHFGTDLPNNQYNYKQKTTCHMISTQLSVLGVISQDDLESLYMSFPDWMKKIQSLNQFIFNKCELNLHKHQNSINLKIRQQILQFSPARKNEKLSDKEYRMVFLENHITYSNESDYDKITQSLDQFLERQNNAIHTSNADLVIQQKIFFYGQEGKVFPIFDSEYQSALKKTSHESLSQIAQVLSGQDASLNDQGEEENLDWQKMLQKYWDRFQFTENSRARQLVGLVQIINLFYIAIITPLVVGFSIPLHSELNFLESISLIVSIAWIIINFRTQAQINGNRTLKYGSLLKYYKHNGLILDILGILPFNIMLGQNVPAKGIVIRSLFRIIRVFSSWRVIGLIFEAEVSYKNNKVNILIQMLKATSCVYVLGHFITCLFYFICDNIDETSKSWVVYQGLVGKPLLDQYLRSSYCVYNIVCGNGSGDMFPTTDQERVYFTVMVSMGDLLFAVGFALIGSLTLQINLANQTTQFRDKMYQIQEFITSFNLDQAQKRKFEQFFAYQYKQKYNSHFFNYDELIVYLPHSLSEEVLYQSSKTLLTSMFKEYNSENLIRKLAVVLGSTTYLPGDFILYKGDIGEEMYFIAEGSVRSLSDDKRTINRSLRQGKFFGETAILYPTKRSTFIQAETFCIIRVLTGEDFRQVAQDFPDIHKQLQDRAEKTKEYSSDEDSTSPKDFATDATQTLSTNELIKFHEIPMNPGSVERKMLDVSEEMKEQDPMNFELISDESYSQYNSPVKRGEAYAQQSQGPETQISRNQNIMISRSRENVDEESPRVSLSNEYPQINSSSEQIQAKPLKKLSRLNLKVVYDEVEQVDKSSMNDLSQSKSSIFTEKKIEDSAELYPDILDFFSDDESSESDDDLSSGTSDCSPRRFQVRRSSQLGGFINAGQQVHKPALNKRKSNATDFSQAAKMTSKTDLDSFQSATGERKSGEFKMFNQNRRDSKASVKIGLMSPQGRDSSPQNNYSDPNMKKYVRLIINQQKTYNRQIQNEKFSPPKEVKSSKKKKKLIKKPKIADLFNETSNDNTNHTIRRMKVNFNSFEKRISNPARPLKLMPVRRLSRVCLGKNLVLSAAASLKLQWTVTS